MGSLVRIVTAAAALPLALLTAAPASAGTQIACGAEVSGRVVLTQDLTCPGTGLVVTKPGTTVDLNGHTIRLTGEESPQGTYGVQVGYWNDESTATTGVTLRNGRIEGYDTGVQGIFAERLTVRGLTVQGSISSYQGADLLVQRSEVTGRVGLEQHGAAVIEGNRLGGAGGSAIGVVVRDNTVTDGRIRFDESRDIRITGNRVTGGPGIEVGSYNDDVLVQGNHVNAAVHGVSLDGVVLDGIVVRDNRIRNSRSAGIDASHLQAVEDVLIEGNDVFRSGFRDVADPYYGPSTDGIAVRTSPDHDVDLSGIVLRGNRVRSSAGHGIYATRVTDGGGNRAQDARLKPTCVGVACGK
ncbi:parallel beta helix pectate lyase-like protein [Kineococcus xinjiangensis]|uniref:Parallel beta helix pectate lyase-like protein n=1 Tax=Kineococcus xinjiangensis TaxID=512762 RepID=A0A2S6ITN2_9ACTN|nr:right-handed parallel beta-helix repeat-containing protein [Kineococcus xinjiangensis]PPK97614.1 parallel beta helix pectate lyase-like protein [Kineococcus xinjiangensis]